MTFYIFAFWLGEFPCIWRSFSLSSTTLREEGKYFSHSSSISKAIRSTSANTQSRKWMNDSRWAIHLEIIIILVWWIRINTLSYLITNHCHFQTLIGQFVAKWITLISFPLLLMLENWHVTSHKTNSNFIQQVNKWPYIHFKRHLMFFTRRQPWNLKYESRFHDAIKPCYPINSCHICFCGRIWHLLVPNIVFQDNWLVLDVWAYFT